jgi:hypothetical protein
VARPRRTVGAGPARRELLVFAEGAVTEETYLKYWHRRFRHSVNVEIHEFHGTPAALVKRAATAKTANERAERKGRGRAHDEVWCVFDVDEHPHLADAIDLATAHGICLAISNPCIELWFLLHFTEQTAYIDRHAVQTRAKAVLHCDKDLDEAALGLLAARFPIAKTRARQLDVKHNLDGTPAPGNPSSAAWRIVDAITRPRPSQST